MASEDPPPKVEEPRERERWSSRGAFYFAAIGSAVGFGNIWRFPALVHDYGGGAFFLPYFLALVFIGLPILVLEISLGQYYETGDVDVFGGIHRRLRGVGLSSIACGYMMLTYYSMLLTWVVHAFVDTFGDDNVWDNAGTTGAEGYQYFKDQIVGSVTLGDDSKPTRLVWANVGYSLFTWAVIYLCIAFGIKWTGRITYFTLGFPVVMIFVLLVRSVSLEGSQEGIQQYIFSDLSVLVDKPEVWSKAVSQVFFSLGISFGIMTAYGSHCHRDEPALLNSCVIAVSDSLYSYVAGVAVFSALGHLAFVEGVEISDLDISGFGLVFGSLPVVLGSLPWGDNGIRLFLFMLFCLGIDSAFSFMEGFLICLDDAAFFGNVDKKYTALGLTVVAWLFSLLYATDAGLNFLDTIDYYINFVMLLVGGFKCFAAGWIYNIEEQVDNLGRPVVFGHMVTTFASVFLASVLWFGIQDTDTARAAGFAGLVGTYAVGMAIVVCLMRRRMRECPGMWSWQSMAYDLLFRNAMDLRDDLAGVVGRLPVAWAVLIKFLIPQAILVLFCAGCGGAAPSGETEFGHYAGYPLLPFNVLGILTVVFAGFLFFSSLVAPRLYDAFQKPDSPVPSKDATIHAAPEATANDNGTVKFSLQSTAGQSAWAKV